jgi:type VI secretion system secreted protein VgrG
MGTGLFFEASDGDQAFAFTPTVLRVDGHEALGSLYEYVVHFSVPAVLSDDDVDALLTTRCRFNLDDDGPAVHGVVREVELADYVEERPIEYRATVVPSVWLLGLSRISRVYQNVTVLDITREILVRFGMKDGEDFEIRSYASYEKRDLYVQFEESDWTFLQRWFEREGLFYWFEHDESGDKLVVADDNKGFRPIPGDPKVPYRDRGNLVRDEESITSWTGRRSRTVARVILKDYNERNPAMPMVGRADADKKTGFGVVFAYGEHFDDAAAGTILARKRAERLMVERVTSSGQTDSDRFHVGAKFEMYDHFASNQNGEYLVTSISHSVVRQEVDPDIPSDGAERELVHSARFDAIPASTPFRSPRTTPWPRIDGVMTGHIDSDTTGEHSTLNEDGRYRVRLPFDSTGNHGESASSWVRMVQSYSGAGYGSHFPLHKGAEVVLSFVGGNPDRPIIVGAIPNAHTPSPTASKNATQSIIHSASGIQFVMDDKTGSSSKTS